MSWWPFSESSQSSEKSSSPYDKLVPPPPSGAFIPPPTKPKNISIDSNDRSFMGFSPPPKISDSYGFSSDYSIYKDDESSTGKWSRFSNLLNNQRTKNCIENVKMGCKMGAAVGGIFGSITGLYASVVHRNLLTLPLSAVGGAISFGFFLGCGMIVRC